MRKFMSALAVSLALSACGGGSDAPETVDVPVTEVAREDYITINSASWPAGGRVVQSDAEWAALWPARTPFVLPVGCNSVASCEAKRPAFDFERYSLIAVFGQLSPGQTIRLASVTQRDGVMQVTALRRNSPGNYVQSQSPFALVFLVPKTTARVVFSEGVES